jgi:hypothetical protein
MPCYFWSVPELIIADAEISLYTRIPQLTGILDFQATWF